MGGGKKDEKTSRNHVDSGGHFFGRRNSLGPWTFPSLWFHPIFASSGGSCTCLFVPRILSTLSVLWLSGLGPGSLGLEMDILWLGKGLDPGLLALKS